MTWVLVVLAVAAAYSAYHLGRRRGRREGVDATLTAGTWVEVREPVAISNTSDEFSSKLPSGVRGIVLGRGRWGKLVLWIAEPWASEWDGWEGPRKVYGVEDMLALRVLPARLVDRETREEAVTSMVEWETELKELQDEIFPAGFLEFQELLHGRSQR